METNRRNTPRCASICLAVVFFLHLVLGFNQSRPDGPRTSDYWDILGHAFIEEAGDVLGTEIRIAYAGDGFQGVVQMAEGAPGRLMLVDVVQSGNDIRFELPADNELPGSFRGKISNGWLRGEFRFKNGFIEKVALRRGKSYWD